MSKQAIREELQDIRGRLERLEKRHEPSEESEYYSDCCSGADRRKDGVVDRSGQTMSATGLAATGLAALRVRSSIDASRNDNGFLGCVYSRYRETSNNTVTSHWTTAQAFSNLRAGSADVSIIVGHGSQGLIVTGTGQAVNGTDKYMSSGNQKSWSPHASGGIPGWRLVLFGCEVGGGTAGRDFIQRMANVVRKEVGAWTGLVWCNNSSVWGTGNFITASPGRQLEAVEHPSMYNKDNNMDTLKIRSASDFEDASIGSVKAVNFTPIGSVPSGARAFNLRGQEAVSLLQAIDFMNPFETEDKPGSILTGQLTITYENADKGESTRTFKLLGYSLVEDACFPNVYYYTSPQVRETLYPTK